MTIQLLCYMQNFVAITLFKFGREQNKFPLNLNHSGQISGEMGLWSNHVFSGMDIGFLYEAENLITVYITEPINTWSLNKTAAILKRLPITMITT